MAKPLSKPKSLKAQITRTSLVLAAAALLRERGPEAVTYRKVAEWAGAASSSVGYYFDSVTELLHEAGCYNIELWIARAEKVAQAADAFSPEECRERVVDLLLEACLPDARYPRPPITLSSSPRPKRRWLPRPTARDARPSTRP